MSNIGFASHHSPIYSMIPQMMGTKNQSPMLLTWPLLIRGVSILMLGTSPCEFINRIRHEVTRNQLFTLVLNPGHCGIWPNFHDMSTFSIPIAIPSKPFQKKHMRPDPTELHDIPR